MSTSWQVKEKYNKKTYKKVVANLPISLVDKWAEKLASCNMSKAEFIRRAITEYLGDDDV